MEQSVSGKHGLFLAILHEPADAVLGVAWRVQRLRHYAADVEGLAVGRRFRHCFAVLAAENGLAGKLGLCEELLVSARVVPVAVMVEKD